MKNPRSLRMLVAILGVLSVAGAAVFNSGFVGQTLANWNDRVFGASSFGVGEAALQGYSQALSGRFQIRRLVTGGVAKGAVAERTASGVGTTHTPVSGGFAPYGDSGLLGLVATSLQAKACASYLSSSGSCGDHGSSASPVHSVAVAKNLETKAGSTDLNVRFFSTSGEEFKTTASCASGASPSAGPVQSSSGVMYLGEPGNNVAVPIPVAPAGTGTRSATATATKDFLFRYRVELTHTTVRESNRASSTLRLRMSSHTIPVIGIGLHQWTMDMVVLHAACGVGTPTPSLPPVNASTSLIASAGPTNSDSLTSMMSNGHEALECETTPSAIRAEGSAIDPNGILETIDSSPAELAEEGPASNEASPGGENIDHASERPVCDSAGSQPTAPLLDLLVEDGVIDEAEPQSELVDREEDVEVNAADAPVDGLEDRVESELGDGRTTDEVATDAESAPAEGSGADESLEPTTPDGDTPGERDESPSADTGTTTAEPTPSSSSPATEPPPASQASGPTTPTRVSPGAPFRMVATDGSDLGRVTVTDISRNSGCVAILLEITTSDGSGNTVLNGLRANDFREVLDDGGSAPVGAPTGGCDVGSSLPTSFAPNTTYSGWVAFGVVNGSNSVMLRPAGTAGWIIGLPVVAAPTTVAVPTVTGTDDPTVETDIPLTVDTTTEGVVPRATTADEPADA